MKKSIPIPTPIRIAGRRQFLVRGGMLLSGAALAALAGSRSARAKAAKPDFYYQDQPRDGKSCSNCRMFTPNSDGKGSCAVVDGEVSATGWCMAYSPRNP